MFGKILENLTKCKVELSRDILKLQVISMPETEINPLKSETFSLFIQTKKKKEKKINYHLACR